MSHRKLKLAFAGTPEIARTILESLIREKIHCVELVLTPPDRPAGRGRKVKQSDVKLCALENNIPVLQPTTSSELLADDLANCDLMLVVAYGLIIKPEILAKPKYGCVNIHTSLLPRWRGAAPIQRAIEAGDHETGITFMQMDSGLDTGPILKQVDCPIFPLDTAGKLHDRLAKLGADHINELILKIANAEIQITEQDNSRANYAKKISKQEAKLDWNEQAVTLDRKIRAFNPFPIAHTKINDIDVRVWEAEIKPDPREKLTPGSVMNSKTSLEIATGEGVLAITKLQLPGKRPVSAKDFLNGHPDFIGENAVVI